MAGLASYMLAGAAQGLGTGIVDRAKSLAAAALEKKREETRQAERAEDRAWGLQDLATKRQWDLDDANTQRQWDLDDAATARKPQEDATAAFNRLFGGDQTGGGDALPASYVRAELMRRGLPEHVAEGFVLSMDDESGLRPGVNEAQPLVPGSRGGYGLYQLTGPRRVAFENWAAQSGRPLDDQAQFDYLTMELQGPERGAAKKIFATRDRNEAASAIAEYFLRPAPENLAARKAKYGTVSEPDQRGRLMALLAMPGLSDGQRAVVENEIKRLEPAKPLSAKGKEAADRDAGFLPDGEGPAYSDRPASVQEYLFAQDQGETRPYSQWLIETKKAGATSINVGGDNSTADQQRADTAGMLLQDIDHVKDLVDSAYLPTTGSIGNLLSSVGGTAANDIRTTLDTIRANIAFDKLAQMRAASKTGAALGSVTERELGLLQSTLGNLEQSQTKEQFIRNLDRLRSMYETVVNGSQFAGAPRVGTVVEGFAYVGGDPNERSSWEEQQ